MDKADIYVRDHLLIEWMIEYVYSHMDDKPEPIEYIYKKWIDYISKEEAKHAEGSKV